MEMLGKKPMMFCKSIADMSAIREELTFRLRKEGNMADPTPCPWIMNFSKPGVRNSKTIQNGKDIKLYLTTSVMEMGVDINNIDIIVMLRPFNKVHDILQYIG